MPVPPGSQALTLTASIPCNLAGYLVSDFIVQMSVLWEALKAFFGHIATVFSFLADSVTVALGFLALWGLIFRRRQLALAFRVLTSAHTSHHVTRLRDTLAKLDALNWNEKERRAEVNALLGQLSGQLAPLVEDYPAFVPVHNDLLEIVQGPGRVTESKKRRIAFQLNGILDKTVFKQQHIVLDDENHG